MRAEWLAGTDGRVRLLLVRAARLETRTAYQGVLLDWPRLQAVLAAYAPILEEIARLRTLDLRDVHPAVVYEPTAPYRARP